MRELLPIQMLDLMMDGAWLDLAPSERGAILAHLVRLVASTHPNSLFFSSSPPHPLQPCSSHRLGVPFATSLLAIQFGELR